MGPSSSTAKLCIIVLLAPSAAARAQEQSPWLAVSGWVDPGSALKRANAPIIGAAFYASGYPITATVLSGALMAGVDLMIRGAVRYHDSRGVTHGRSWATSLTGATVFAASGVIASRLAPWAARRANVRRVAEAEARARELASSRVLPGLALGDTANLRSLVRSTNPEYAVSAHLAATDLYFRVDGAGSSRIDSTQALHVMSVRRNAAGPNLAALALGLTTGLAGAIAACVKRFEY